MLYVTLPDAAALVTAAVAVLLSALASTLLLRRRGAWGWPAALSRARAPPAVLECIRRRASVFPRSYTGEPVPRDAVARLLEAAMWAPYHGPRPPWRFVVLGRPAILSMQRVTLAFYKEHWRECEWKAKPGGGAAEDTAEGRYRRWRAGAEADMADGGRWAPVSWMLAITVRRQAGSKRMPMWEEECATACAVQNMHLQASATPGMACYWSSWHAAARDSEPMRAFLGMGAEDTCLGFFVIASCDGRAGDAVRARRSRRMDTHMSAEWRE